MNTDFTRAELEAIYTLFRNSNVVGQSPDQDIASGDMKLAIMKKAHAAIRENEKLKASLAASVEKK